MCSSDLDNDLLKSLEIRPDDPYSLNYLAYSWLERNHKIDEAIQMLEKAYVGKENDPYITDSVGWGYYLIGDYQRAEKYLRRAVELMPEDPIVNDHYGDVLWQLNRKMQASYFWKNVLELEDNDDLVFLTQDAKFKALIEEIELLRKKDAPILVGTASVESSEIVSALLNKKNISHQVLNAKQHEKEAEVIANAGRPGVVTIATNMAGRGTDIVLGDSKRMG